MKGSEMNSGTIKRLRSYYRELPWLKAVLQDCESSIDDVSRQNADCSHLECKIGKQKIGDSSSFVSVILANATGTQFVELTPRVTPSPLRWVFTLCGFIKEAQHWTLYGALQRLQEGRIKNPNAMIVEDGKWIVILQEREVKRMFSTFAKYELTLKLLKVKRETKLNTLMSEYDKHAWQHTEVLERRPRRGMPSRSQEVTT